MSESATPPKPSAAEGPGFKFRLYLTRGLVVLLLAAVTLVTKLYCSEVYYNREAAFEDALECSVRTLEKEKVSFWLQNGTLLGATRLGRLILWDVDLDFGVMRRQGDDVALTSVLHSVSDLCFGYSSRVRLGAVNKDLYVWRLCTGRICAEFHEFELVNGNTCRSGDGQSALTELEPLEPCTVAGVEAKCPHNSAFYLAQAYGKEWLTRPLTKLF